MLFLLIVFIIVARFRSAVIDFRIVYIVKVHSDLLKGVNYEVRILLSIRTPTTIPVCHGTIRGSDCLLNWVNQTGTETTFSKWSPMNNPFGRSVDQGQQSATKYFQNGNLYADGQPFFKYCATIRTTCSTICTDDSKSCLLCGDYTKVSNLSPQLTGGPATGGATSSAPVHDQQDHCIRRHFHSTDLPTAQLITLNHMPDSAIIELDPIRGVS